MHPDHLARLLSGQADWALSARDWEQLLSQARRASLSARLALASMSGASTGVVPARVQTHLDAALKVQRRRAQAMRVEVNRIAQALGREGIPCLLLKGAAYLVAGLPPANGRIFGDIDVMVPIHDLARAESALLRGGWISSDLGPYNQRYYREWMHEIPPLTHVSRGSIVDLHHTIAPPTSVFRVDGAALLAATKTVDPEHCIRVLQPIDMVLHSAVHLFTEGEFDHGLRDLLDMRDLLVHFSGVDDTFWELLLTRAAELSLERPLYHALLHIERLFGPVVPNTKRSAVEMLRPPWLRRLLMEHLLTVALRPMHPSRHSPGEGIVRWLLYVRSHWLRMPLRLLVPHLVRKAWLSRLPPTAGTAQTEVKAAGGATRR
jgi:hypothetical protein